MGGDFGPRSIVQACIASLSATPSLHLTLVGQPSLLEELIASHPAVDRARLTITPASETITMDEKPAAALRGKPDSSMRVALELLRRDNLNSAQWEILCQYKPEHCTVGNIVSI